MARKKHRNKENIRYWQFEGGYAQAWDTQLRAVLEGYRLGHFRRNEVRVFAARLEFAARHPNSKRLQLARILNWNSHHKGNRRLSASQIDDAARKLDQYLPKLHVEFEAEWEQAERTSCLKPVARAVLRHIASGGATTVEALFCIAFFMRRIPQRKPMQRLLQTERYARFRYADFQEWTGVHRATQCRMLRRLVERGYLNIVPVSQQNANAYGQLFVDGPVLSLVRRQPASNRRRRPPFDARDKKSTPRQEKVNAPLHKRSTLINVNLKMEIEEEQKFVWGLTNGFLGRHRDPDLQRIVDRAVQEVENRVRQAA
jgi:hypothetical protein